jgi:hypothetical protein
LAFKPRIETPHIAVRPVFPPVRWETIEPSRCVAIAGSLKDAEMPIPDQVALQQSTPKSLARNLQNAEMSRKDSAAVKDMWVEEARVFPEPRSKVGGW